ncbi:MAG: hypothetical protein IKG70_05280 [Lachnospiraceae bacterium]|nr:hypothetical protein [Lachnospiraceae bacterium]
MKPLTFVKRLICYLGGMALIAISINLSKLAALGIAPVTSASYALEQIWGITLGATTYILMVVFLLLQILILRKNFPIRNLFGLLVTFWFSFVIDLTGIDPNAVGHLMVNAPRPQSYIARLLLIGVCVVLTGIGVFIYVRLQWIPMPSDGVPDALHKAFGWNFGNCKTLFDTSLVALAVILQLVYLGGLSSFTGSSVVVREGTIAMAVLVGQVVKLLTRFFGEKYDRWLELDRPRNRDEKH